MSTVQQVIEVGAPVHAVYEQLAAFESYPRFMTGVEQVTQISDDRTHWVMDLDGQRQEFDAEITECAPDERVAWRSTSGPMLGETITLRPVGETRTQIVAQMEADVAALMPSDLHAQESLSRRLKADLASFKRLIESDAAMGGATMGGIADLASPASVANRAGSRTTGSPRASGGMSGANNEELGRGIEL